MRDPVLGFSGPLPTCLAPRAQDVHASRQAVPVHQSAAFAGWGCGLRSATSPPTLPAVHDHEHEYASACIRHCMLKRLHHATWTLGGFG